MPEIGSNWCDIVIKLPNYHIQNIPLIQWSTEEFMDYFCLYWAQFLSQCCFFFFESNETKTQMKNLLWMQFNITMASIFAKQCCFQSSTMNESFVQKKEQFNSTWLSIGCCILSYPGQLPGRKQITLFLSIWKIFSVNISILTVQLLQCWTFSAFMYYWFLVHDFNEAINFVCFLYHEANYYIFRWRMWVYDTLFMNAYWIWIANMNVHYVSSSNSKF